MNLKSLIACALLLSLAVATIFGQSPSTFDLANIDKNTQACNDFFQYAVGGWLARNPIPAAFPSWGVDSAWTIRTATSCARFSKRPRKTQRRQREAANKRWETFTPVA